MIYGGGQEETDTVFKNFDRIKEMDSIIDYSIIVRFNGIMKNNNKSISIHAYEGSNYENYEPESALQKNDLRRRSRSRRYHGNPACVGYAGDRIAWHHHRCRKRDA